MIDLHCHILPGLDDGASSMEEALEMARIAADAGTRVIAATAHGLPEEHPEEYLRRYTDILERFRGALAVQGIPLQVVSGMEVRISEAVLRFAEKHPLPTLNGGAWLLAEFRFDVPSRRITDSLGRLMERGYRIVLAHPERYDCAWKNPAFLYELHGQGIVLQVNGGSLLGNFGRRARSLSRMMVRDEIAGAVASDAHDALLRTPELESISLMLELYAGRAAASFLLEKNPAGILGIRFPAEPD